MKKYNLTFEFADTEEKARTFCNAINRNYTRYMRKNHPAHYTPWSSQDGKEQKFVCWYRY